MSLHESTKHFMKGTLPSWASSLMLLILCAMAANLMHEFVEFKTKVQETITTVSVMQEHNRSVDAAINELRMGQKDVLTELRVINASLQKR